ncbi:MAG: TonB-dependent receptor [Candidatus Eremiobacteraeota bacterium]|nr:TonB-dependent receptor [Candidatus Eremiobacteraeota bacterium]
MPVSAGTTGGIHGRVLDADTSQPIAAASVSVTSPSQAETRTTDTGGYYSFISLAPDTYTVTVKKDGYSIEQVPGITVISDQNRTLEVRPHKATKTLGRVEIRGGGGLVRAGVTSDVYSINAAGQKAAATIGGAGSLNQAYGSIASAPGVNYDQGQQGWYQNIYIRGGDIDQVAYEFDGVPVIRESDWGAVTTLTSLGQQEVQVYTGGTPASADASGLAGYINQVIKTGTYPGYGNFTLGFGAPTLYNKAALEVAGATPDRNFSYYIGTQLVGQSYRFDNQFNGAGDPRYFYPISTGAPLNGLPGIWDGTAPFLFAPGPTNAIAQVSDRETIMNFHFGLPHKRDSGKDDIQLLYDNSLILQKFNGSILDQGVANVQQAFGGPLTYFDGFAYNGPIFQAPDATLGSVVLFPNSPQNRPMSAQLPVNEREGSQNGVQLTKFQYQRNIDTKSYLRFFAYTDHAVWLISGPVSSDLVYGGQLPDYEVFEHKYGGNLIYSRQIGDKHLVNLTTSYFTSKLETYSAQFANFNFLWQPLSNLIDGAGNCYTWTTGVQISCFPGFNPTGSPPDPNNYGTISSIVGGVAQGLTPGTAPPGSPAALAGAQWIVTEGGPRAQIDKVTPYFSSYSATDQWRPTERLTLNLGLRVENFTYHYEDLASGFPARQFWYNAYNREHCFGPGLVDAIARTFDPVTGAESPCPAGTSPTNVVNFAGGRHSEVVWQPRLGATFQVNPDTVLRVTYGRYARPAATSYQEFSTVQQDSATFVSQFLNLGYNSPIHPLHADTANNYDLSLEQHLRGTDISYKLTPYYRNTQGQVQFLSLNAQGVLAGVNAGQQRSYGIEFAINKSDFSREGFSAKASVTLLRSRIKYSNFPSGNNIIDLLNTYIRNYNSFTSACAGANADPNLCGNLAGANAQPSFFNATSMVTTTNPYYTMAPQPLFDRSGEYTTYSVVPSPYNDALGYETPFSTTLILNYKHKNWNVTPSFTFTTGSSYGSPLVWPGYDPSTCGNADALGNNVGPSSCTGSLFIPDKYTGKFDNLGSLRQPARLTANVSLGWQPSERVGATLSVTSLIDHCFQRGYAWDSSSTCVYAQLPSNLLAPAGNFVANPPIQLAYPYSSWYNNTEIGQEGIRLPTSATLELNFKL